MGGRVVTWRRCRKGGVSLATCLLILKSFGSVCGLGWLDGGTLQRGRSWIGIIIGHQLDKDDYQEMW